METPDLVKNDPWLEPFASHITQRRTLMESAAKRITNGGALSDFADGYLYFGLHQTATGWVFREWAPNATAIFMIGEFSDWRATDDYALHRLQQGIWEIELPFDRLWHGALFRLLVRWKGGEGERIPSYAKRCVQDERTKVFSAQVWAPAEVYCWKAESPARPAAPLIYESHVGMATEEYRVGTFTEYRDHVVPYVKEAGYNTIQLMAIQEHPYYGSFGYHVSNFFAVSSRFGTPDEFKSLVDAAHAQGLRVIMDLVHSHSVKNTSEGLNVFDGTPSQYFFGDEQRRNHPAWDSLCFDYGKNQVLHFLLSNCKFWLEEYHLDGFRFDGITSMLYWHHGLGRNFTEYGMYFDGSENTDATTYLMLANRLIHEVKPEALTIAEEMSGMPGIATPIEQGGIGFDYRLAMGTPDYWIKLLKERSDNEWNMGEIYYEMTNKRSDEQTVGYVESHDQALVGDKTIFFRLVDREIYTRMSLGDQSLLIDRGIALHKLIRLLTFGTAGNGYLCFMGNEFGHPEWIDFPREGNGWSYQYARRQWSLLQDKNLKFRFLAAFDRAMLALGTSYRIFDSRPELLLEDRAREILAFRRGELVFVFNFHPTQSYTDFGIPTGRAKFRVALSSDDERFAGFDRIDTESYYFTHSIFADRPMENTYLKCYLPSRCAIVFRQLQAKSIYELA